MKTKKTIKRTRKPKKLGWYESIVVSGKGVK
jgi:hypothetical protein